MKRNVILFLICISFSSTFYSKAQTCHYIDNSASGTNNGTSWINAWQSFSVIDWNLVNPMDTIFISGGNIQKTYVGEFNIATSGNESGYITIKVGQTDNHNGKVIFSEGIKIRYSKNYIIIDGNYNGNRHFIVNNPNDRGVNIYNSHNITIRYSEIADCGDGSDEHGIHVNYQCHNIKVEHCYIHNVYQDGINFNCRGDGYDDFIVSYCKIENTGDDGIQCVGGVTVHDTEISTDRIFRAPGAHPDGIQLNPELTHLKVYNSTIKNFSQNIFIEQSRGHVMIYNNIICQDDFSVSGTGRGIAIGPSDEVPTVGPFVVANNVLYNFNSYNALMAGTWEPGPFEEDDDVVMENNIFLNNRHHFAGQIEFLSSNNLFYNNPDMVYYADNGTVVNGDGGNIPAGSLIEDPMFVDYVNHNFQLTESSPAIDKGTSLLNYGISTDFQYTTRPSGAGWDLGIHEYTDGNNNQNNEPPAIPGIKLYPNPVVKSATLEYNLAIQGKVIIDIHDITGKKIETILNEVQPEGAYELPVNLSGFPSGLYLFRIEIAENTYAKKCVVVK